MLSVFTTPKPFRGHVGVIQTNAIRSWVLLRPSCEITLLGDEEGTAEVAAELGIQYVPHVERNEYGTPLINSIFSIAQDIASHPLVCYVNADIILMSNFLTAIRQIQMPSFLLIGRRWDIDLKESLDFSSPDWEEQLRARLVEAGKLHSLGGLDYFVFPRSTFHNVPPFAIGRSGWDNWLVYQARLLKVPVIDATRAVTAIHQNHDYAHIPSKETGVWKGREALRNRELTRQGEHSFTLDHATWILTPEGMTRALTMRHLYFRLVAMPVLFSYLHFLYRPMKVLTRLIIHIRTVLGMTQS